MNDIHSFTFLWQWWCSVCGTWCECIRWTWFSSYGWDQTIHKCFSEAILNGSKLEICNVHACIRWYSIPLLIRHSHYRYSNHTLFFFFLLLFGLLANYLTLRMYVDTSIFHASVVVERPNITNDASIFRYNCFLFFLGKYLCRLLLANSPTITTTHTNKKNTHLLMYAYHNGKPLFYFIPFYAF